MYVIEKVLFLPIIALWAAVQLAKSLILGTTGLIDPPGPRLYPLTYTSIEASRRGACGGYHNSISTLEAQKPPFLSKLLIYYRI